MGPKRRKHRHANVDVLVRFTPGEYNELQRIGLKRNIAVTTIVREAAMQYGREAANLLASGQGVTTSAPSQVMLPIEKAVQDKGVPESLVRSYLVLGRVTLDGKSVGSRKRISLGDAARLEVRKPL